MNLWILAAALVLIGAVGCFLSVSIIRRQKRFEQSEPMPDGMVKHQLWLNPVFISFVVFKVVIVALSMYYFWYYGFPNVQ